MLNRNILLDLRSVLTDKTSIADLPEEAIMELSVHNTYGTNAIEGNKLTLEEVEAVLMNKMTTPNRSINDLLETVQHDAVFRGMWNRLTKPIDLVTVLELQGGVFHGLKMDAGQWRRVNVVIGNIKFRPPSYDKVVTAMEKWEKTHQQIDKGTADAMVVGAVMHTSFERIHPFSDGNGRVGRLLLNLHLIKHNWPPVNLGPEERNRYYIGLQQGGDGDIGVLVRLLEVSMSRSLLLVLDKVGTDEDLLRPLKELEEADGYSQKFLSLRARQGELPALKVKNEYRSSMRAVTLYKKYVGQ